MIRYKRIYIPQSQRLNHEAFNDDPEVLISLPLSEKTSEFWKRYDRQADTHDTKMTEDLSENLDVLLIFAALFSAINTAFISLTMPGLSSDPLTETNTLLRLLVMRADNKTLLPTDLSPPFAPSPNSVVVNCLLYASLSCSLLAAMGAMMAKEWLQSFDRTGQTGPLEEQGRFRQRKFNGVQQWHLESIIRSLPNILLLSVILFFAGICSFLFPVNKTVASTVIAFSGVGAILCGVAIIAGATSPLCPYQSAASRALRRMAPLFSPLWWKGLGRAVIDLGVRKPPKVVRKVLDAIHRYPRVAPAILQSMPPTLVSGTLGKTSIPEQAEAAQSAGWLLGTTSNRSDQIAAAQFICTLDRTAYSFAFKDSETRQRLVFLTHEAFDIWYYRPTEANQEIAELLGLVLSRVLIQPSKNASHKEDLTNHPLYQSSSFGGTFLRAFEFAATNYMCCTFEDKEIIFHVAFLLAITSRGSVIPEYRWTKLSRFFLTRDTSHLVDGLLGLWSKVFCNTGSVQGAFNQSHTFEDLVYERDNTRVLARDLSNALISGTRVLSSIQEDLQSEIGAAQGYIACLQRMAELFPQKSRRELPSIVIDGVVDCILSYVDRLTSSTLEKSRSEWVRLSAEAVLAFHALISRNTSPDEVPIVRDTMTGGFRIGDLINATARVLSNDFESLANSKLLPRAQPQMLTWARTTAMAIARGEHELGRNRKMGQALKLELERVMERGRLKQARGWMLIWRSMDWREDDLNGDLGRDLEKHLERYLEQTWDRVLGGALGGTLGRSMHGVLKGTLQGVIDVILDRVLEGASNETLSKALDPVLAATLDRVLAATLAQGLGKLQNKLQDRMFNLANDLAQRLRVESYIIRILLWVWKTTSGTQSSRSEKRQIFISSCLLWAPLETRVDFTTNGIKAGIEGERIAFGDHNREKLLTPDDLNGILEFAEDIQKDREKCEFIARNADVGINRLYVHFGRQVDWNYALYDFREQRTWCPRSKGKGIGMIW